MKKGLVIISLLLFVLFVVLTLPDPSINRPDISRKIKFDRYRKKFTFFQVNLMPFRIPIAGWPLDSLLKQSVLYLPDDIVRDGLPWFGALRDDWLPGRESRYHQGIDIYGDTLTIIAVRDGIVEKTGRDGFSGGIIKLDHGRQIKTVYIHLSDIFVTQGTPVNGGMPIGQILRAEGNARESQLHFELQVDGIKKDPIYYIRETYRYAPEINCLLDLYLRQKKQLAGKRRQAIHRIK